MSKTSKSFEIGGVRVRLGDSKSVHLKVSETYSGQPVHVPLKVIRAQDPGPAIFVTGGIHGDEINGMGIVRALMFDESIQLVRGTLVLVPVVNVLGFERFSRYLPDRRDLNRSFPGTATGSLSGRLAYTIFNEVVKRCQFGIDLHSAAVRRTNFPNVRADLKDPAVRQLALAFGSELVIAGRGPKGSFRRSACAAGVPTIILEAGEVWKVEPSVVEIGVRGVKNVLISLGMLGGRIRKPPYQVCVEKTNWVRATYGGVLRFHVAPGDFVVEGQPLATNSDLLGEARNTLTAPFSGVILGMTTLPAVKPGDPVCHLAIVDDELDQIREALDRVSERSIHLRVRDDLATSVDVSQHEDYEASIDDQSAI